MDWDFELNFVVKAWNVERRPLTDAEISTVYEYAKTLRRCEQVDLPKRFGLCADRGTGGSSEIFASALRTALSNANRERIAERKCRR